MKSTQPQRLLVNISNEVIVLSDSDDDNDNNTKEDHRIQATSKAVGNIDKDFDNYADDDITDDMLMDVSMDFEIPDTPPFKSNDRNAPIEIDNVNSDSSVQSKSTSTNVDCIVPASSSKHQSLDSPSIPPRSSYANPQNSASPILSLSDSPQLKTCNDTNEDIVKCPNCAANLSMSLINFHLDECLMGRL